MIDITVEKNLESCRQLLKFWQQFRMFLVACGEPSRTFTPQEEAQFLRLKSEVAMIYDAFFDSLEGTSRDSIATAQSIMNIVQSCITLRQVQALNAAERRKFEIEWHESYMLINETIATLEDKQSQLADITPSQHRKAEMAKSIKNTIHRIQASTGGMAVGAVVLVVVGIIAAFALDIGEINATVATSSWGGGIYRFGQKILRDIGFTNISYKTWEVFEESGKPKEASGYKLEKGFGPTAETQKMKETALNTIFKDKKPEIIREEVYGFKHNTSPSMNYAVCVVLFKKTDDAIQVCFGSAIEPKDNALKDKLGLSGDLENVAVWRQSNAVYFLSNVGGGGAAAVFKLVR